MRAIRVHVKAVIIAVLLLAIMLCSIVLYTMETGKTQMAQAGTIMRPAHTVINATPVSSGRMELVELKNAAVKVTVDGKTVTVNAPEGTVEDFLKVAGVTLGEQDKVLPRLSTKLTDGASISVITVLYKEETESILIPYETEYVEDGEMYDGYSEVEQYGIFGTALNTYKVKYRGGKVVSKELIHSEEESAPQTQIIRYGTLVVEEEEEYYEEEPEVIEVIEEETEETEEPVEEELVEPSEEPSEEPAEETEAPEEVPAEEPQEISYNVSFENDYQRYAYEQCAAYGWDDQNFMDLVSLWNRESRWNPTAYNSYSGAYGIPQALPGKKMASYGEDWETNGYVQVDWGLNYIAGRYGSPSAAWSFFCGNGWY